MQSFSICSDGAHLHLTWFCLTSSKRARGPPGLVKDIPGWILFQSEGATVHCTCVTWKRLHPGKCIQLTWKLHWLDTKLDEYANYGILHQQDICSAVLFKGAFPGLKIFEIHPTNLGKGWKVNKCLKEKYALERYVNYWMHVYCIEFHISI